jgi:hypothetical protein
MIAQVRGSKGRGRIKINKNLKKRRRIFQIESTPLTNVNSAKKEAIIKEKKRTTKAGHTEKKILLTGF